MKKHNYFFMLASWFVLFWLLMGQSCVTHVSDKQQITEPQLGQYISKNSRLNWVTQYSL